MLVFAQRGRGNSHELKRDVICLRKELKTREEMGAKCVADAERRLASTNERAATMLDNLFEQEVSAMFAKNVLVGLGWVGFLVRSLFPAGIYKSRPIPTKNVPGIRCGKK